MDRSRISLRRSLVTIISFLLIAGTADWTLALDYPTRAITMIVPFSPGGGADLGSKVIAEKLSSILGKPIISEYKPGAGGGLGAALVAKAKPDGYTFVVGSQTTLMINPMTKKDLGYNFDDFIQVSGYSMIPITINAKSGGPWNTLPEFIADAKKNPGKYRYGTYGALSQAHFVMELLCKAAGIKLIHIPFLGSPQANTALLGGHVELACTTGTGGLYQAGSLKILAHAEPKRLPGMEEVPTLTELGYPIVFSCNYSFAFPKGTPMEIINKIYEAEKQVFVQHQKEVAAQLEKVEQYPSFEGPQEIRQKYLDELKIYQAIAEELGAQ
jgi:tripartite-type tricarboxylate transporter receptor subunit TctC